MAKKTDYFMTARSNLQIAAKSAADDLQEAGVQIRELQQQIKNLQSYIQHQEKEIKHYKKRLGIKDLPLPKISELA